ncbi:MAG: enoyl-CoA hydratase/isomerase family protein [Desulfobacteraceae bacterium]|nr:enoyl-CoA hydratase/isomerase family protein [Desulfobacteraceae bacterium]
MQFEDIIYEKKNQVAKVIINRPSNANMFRAQTLLEMKDALEDSRKDEDVRVAVISGAGEKFFCIGGDKADLEKTFSYKGVLPVLDLYDLMDKHPKPIIAAVDGFAVGGGNVLHVVCDFTIATDRSVFRQVGPMMGSFDAGYGTWYLEDLVGKKKAKEMWMLGRKYSAQQALDMGLINSVVPPDKLEEEVEQWCSELINRGPQALYSVKASFTARNSGVAGMSRMAHDLLLTYYVESREAKELNRSFSRKEEPNQDEFYK